MSIWFGNAKKRYDSEVKGLLEICENVHPLILILGILAAFGLLAISLVVAITIF